MSSEANGTGQLRRVIDLAKRESGLSLAELTVLEKKRDPFRFDTPAGHRSGFRGAKRSKGTPYWEARLANQHLGIFDTPEAAVRAYDATAIERFGVFAITTSTAVPWRACMCSPIACRACIVRDGKGRGRPRQLPTLGSYGSATMRDRSPSIGFGAGQERNHRATSPRACFGHNLPLRLPVPADRDPSLIGHTSVAFQCGWIVNRVPIFRSREGRISCGTPSSAELDGEGRVKTWSDGKRDRGQRAVLGALADARIGAGAA